ncbi:MAG: type II toxin-antitoxin system VapC family toxin [Acidobacteria bacterium]|nr:type II toxin-antitoxin system VapC family toxin [Acidobacteriota bacterium]
MKALLDTHTFLWWVTDDPLLSATAREWIGDGRNECFLSAASAWEIAIQFARGNLELPEPPERYVLDRMSRCGFKPLAVKLRHALHVSVLPPHHKDPFDRLLVSQAALEGLALISADPIIPLYGIPMIW